MSNVQVGTRPVSSGDWTRLKRIQGAGRIRKTPVGLPQTLYSPEFLSPKTTGSSKIRNETSVWTDFKAWSSADFITQSDRTVENAGKVLTRQTYCPCTTSILHTKVGLCAL